MWNKIGFLSVHVQLDIDVVLADRERKIRNMASEDTAAPQSLDKTIAERKIEAAHGHPELIIDREQDICPPALAGHVFVSKLKRRGSPCDEMRGGLVDLVENSCADELNDSVAGSLGVIVECLRAFRGMIR